MSRNYIYPKLVLRKLSFDTQNKINKTFTEKRKQSWHVEHCQRHLWRLSVAHLCALVCLCVWKCSCRLQPSSGWRVWSRVWLKKKGFFQWRKLKCSTEAPDIICLGFLLKMKSFFWVYHIPTTMFLYAPVNRGLEKKVPYCVLPLDKHSESKCCPHRCSTRPLHQSTLALLCLSLSVKQGEWLGSAGGSECKFNYYSLQQVRQHKRGLWIRRCGWIH